MAANNHDTSEMPVTTADMEIQSSDDGTSGSSNMGNNAVSQNFLNITPQLWGGHNEETNQGGAPMRSENNVLVIQPLDMCEETYSTTGDLTTSLQSADQIVSVADNEISKIDESMDVDISGRGVFIKNVGDIQSVEEIYDSDVQDVKIEQEGKDDGSIKHEMPDDGKFFANQINMKSEVENELGSKLHPQKIENDVTSNLNCPAESKQIKAQEPTYYCTKCELPFLTEEDLCEHTKIFTGDDMLDCAYCEQSFDLNCDLIRHVKASHEGKQSHLCGVCDETFYTIAMLQCHVKVHFSCPRCKAKCDDMTSFKEHLSIHNPAIFSCLVCGKNYRQKNFAFAHIRKAHNLAVEEAREKIGTQFKDL